MKYYLLLPLLFLVGCTSYTTLRYETFSMQIPSWEDYAVLQTAGITNGFSSSNEDCSFNLTISRDTYLQVAHPFFERLRASDPASILQYEVFEFFIALHYRLEGRLGDTRISTCPSGLTYFIDFSCIEDAYDSYSSIIQSSFDSMSC